MKKLKSLQEKIHSAAWLCGIRCPIGVNEDLWNQVVSDLYDANQMIDGMVAYQERKAKK